MKTPNCFYCIHRIGEWNPETGYDCDMGYCLEQTVKGNHECKSFEYEGCEFE